MERKSLYKYIDQELHAEEKNTLLKKLADSHETKN